MVLIVLLMCFSFRFCFGLFVFRHRRLSARYCVGLVGSANKGLRNSWFLRAWRHQSPCSCAGVSAILKRESYSPMLSSVADFGHRNQPVPQQAASVLCSCEFLMKRQAEGGSLLVFRSWPRRGERLRPCRES